MNFNRILLLTYFYLYLLYILMQQNAKHNICFNLLQEICDFDI
jgi:hypothetical protein